MVGVQGVSGSDSADLTRKVVAWIGLLNQVKAVVEMPLIEVYDSVVEYPWSPDINT